MADQSADFAASLPMGPLTAHLAAMHALYVHLGAQGDVLAIAKHHLRNLAAFTAEQPGWPPSPRGDLIRLREAMATLADEFEADFKAHRHDHPASYLRLRERLNPPGEEGGR